MPKYKVKHVPLFDCFSVFQVYWWPRPDEFIKSFYYPMSAKVEDMLKAKEEAHQFITQLKKVE